MTHAEQIQTERGLLYQIRYFVLQFARSYMSDEEKGPAYDSSQLEKVAQKAVEKSGGSGPFMKIYQATITILISIVFAIGGYVWNNLHTTLQEHLKWSSDAYNAMSIQLNTNKMKCEAIEREGGLLKAEIRDTVNRIEKMIEKLDEKISRLK